jgi:hypothetical protein
MALKIMPHGRLQEWVADEKGYFTSEGLQYSFLIEGDYGIHAVRRDDSGEIKSGAFETFEAGRDGADVSCACHWATNVAASKGTGRHRGTHRFPALHPGDLHLDPAVGAEPQPLPRPAVRPGQLRRGRSGLSP